MAKRRFFKRAARRVYARAVAPKRRASRRHSSGGNPMTSVLLPAFAYGAVRQTAKSYTSGLTDKLPFGANNDELAYGLLGYYMHKKGTGFIKNAGTAILTVEAASLGNNIVSPMVSGSAGTSSSQLL